MTLFDLVLAHADARIAELEITRPIDPDVQVRIRLLREQRACIVFDYEQAQRRREALRRAVGY